jgi:hypothetical protein
MGNGGSEMGESWSATNIMAPGEHVRRFVVILSHMVVR